MVDSFIRPPEGYESAFSSRKSGSRFSSNSLRSDSGIDSREPYEIVIDKNLRSRRKRQQDNTRDELTSVLKRVENVRISILKYNKLATITLKRFLYNRL